jgi:hypothetical protein
MVDPAAGVRPGSHRRREKREPCSDIQREVNVAAWAGDKGWEWAGATDGDVKKQDLNLTLCQQVEWRPTYGQRVLALVVCACAVC